MRSHRTHRVALAVAFGLALAPGVVRAEHEDGFMKSPAKKAERLREKLSLTDEQTQQVQGILESAHESIEASQAAIKQRLEQADQEILAVLNDEQKPRYATMQEERRKKWQERKDKWQERKEGEREEGEREEQDEHKHEHDGEPHDGS